MAEVTMPRDPRTVIAQMLHKTLTNGNGTALTTVAIAEHLAYWLTMEAGKFEPFDERAPGYYELAERLRAR